MTAPFVHLHVHSQYSLLNATASVHDIVHRAKECTMGAIALTDHGNLYGAIDFYKACKEAKIKPIIGCELFVAPTSRFEKKKLSNVPTSFHLTLLAKNKIGYHNLVKLSSLGFTEGFYYDPRIDFELLKKHSEGLICLSGCAKSQIAHAILRNQDIPATVAPYLDLFKEDFYFEIQRHQMSKEDILSDGTTEETWVYHAYEEEIEHQTKINTTLLDLSKKLGVKIVATNDVHYLNREDFKAHELFTNIQSGEPCILWQEDAQGVRQNKIPNPKRTIFPSHELYFKSPEEMTALFKDIPEALTETLAIAEKCTMQFDFSVKHYPVYFPPNIAKETPPEERKKAAANYLLELCEKAIQKRYPPEKLQKIKEKYPDKDPLEIVRHRLEYEMSVIVPKDMCDYLLIVWDFIHWAKSNGIPMGPGRGSGAGSIICYLIGITDIEPLRFSLFFERFINPERVSYPDIDVDICMERRNEVINYTIEKYGKDNVAQIITFGSMKAKMVIRDVGRMLSVPLAKVNTIAKLIPEELNITIEEALNKDVDLKSVYDNDPEARELIDIAKKLEGSVRSTGIHAAGLIISGEPLIEHIPICVAKDSDMSATQYSMKPVELVGMLKIDFLGLKTLTSLQIAQNSLREKGIAFDWTSLPLDDKKTFQLLNKGKTQGVFQLESEGMQELAKNLHLDRFEEIIAVVSLYRPGPMDMIPSFIARKHKREPIEYDHPWMEAILSETYGIMVYQEQVMQIASKLANYSLGEGDVLRRAMGKKDAKEMARQREKFTAGCAKNGIALEIATVIFDKMEKFAEYGFNKSHAAAYGYISYATAFCKAHYPAEWLAALMTSDRDDIAKIAKFTLEGREMGIAILPPNINESFAYFAASSSGIRYALTGIKGVGLGIVENIVKERKAKGPFSSLYDFVRRMSTQGVNKKAVELLIDAGCFDFTTWHRDALKASLDAQFDFAQKSAREESMGYLSLFGDTKNTEKEVKMPVLPKVSSKEEQLFREKELLGFFLSGHPLDSYRPIIQRLGVTPLDTIFSESEPQVFRAAFLIDDVGIRLSSKTQKKFAILTISDSNLFHTELPIWPELFEECQQHIAENRPVLAVLSRELRDGAPQVTCKWMVDLRAVNEQMTAVCDAIYDKTKWQVHKGFFGGKGKGKTKEGTQDSKNQKKESELQIATPQKISISFNIDRVKMGDIVRLRTLLQESTPGPSQVEIAFISKEASLGSIQLDKSITIEKNAALEQKLRTFAAFLEIK